MGLHHHTSTEHMLALGVHNTLEEIIEAQQTAQYHRLAQTRTGRAILNRIGKTVSYTSPKEATPLPRDVIRRIRIPPLPKHMHPQNDHERRRARAIALTKNHRDDPHAYYVDVAKYPHMKNAYAAAVLRASTGEITSAGSIRCKTPAQAEEYAIALAMDTTGCHTILSDAKTAVINYSHDSVHPTTTRVLTALTQHGRMTNNVTIKWFPAHTGDLNEPDGPNRNEEADREAHALTRRGLPSLPLESEPATDPDSEDVNYAITQYGEVLHPEIYHTDTCQRCGRARATQNHILWECLPPPPNTQNGQIPEEIDKKITSEEYETQRDTVRHVLELLDLQKPGTTDRSQDVS
ncbi:hypothetical protein HPB52_007187 [Rhipicephalus sanguineus]|uniref:Tick transposon n=1 Tax=Rhipicephalus sanguineus TaxID=34632 RepID=A0A9D4Q5C5_RHISA|nr:hypothetical protein HPB52_007187 [Rhipicephalus sanguineus]